MYEYSADEVAAYEKVFREEWRRVSDRDLQDEADYVEREIDELEMYDAIQDGMLDVWDYAGGLVYRRRLIRDELARRKRLGPPRFHERPSLTAFSHLLKERLALHEYIVWLGYCPDMRRRGKWHLARCPFHGEKTPSFFVFSEPLGHFKCFGCGIGGDAYDFLMTANQVEGWRQAVEKVADYLGEPLPHVVTSRW